MKSGKAKSIRVKTKKRWRISYTSVCVCTWVESDDHMYRSSNISGVTHEIKTKLIKTIFEKQNLKILTLV